MKTASYIGPHTSLTALICRTRCMTLLARAASLAGIFALSNKPSNARNRLAKNRCTPSPPRDLMRASMRLTQALTLMLSWCLRALSHFWDHFFTPVCTKGKERERHFYSWRRSMFNSDWPSAVITKSTDTNDVLDKKYILSTFSRETYKWGSEN